MTDEEKAEEQAKTYIIDLCAYCRECEKGRCSHTDDAIFGYKDGYKKGLSEGRKESLDVLICEQEHNQMLIKENETMKTILLDVFKKHGDLCSLCEAKGQKLPECKCMKDNECLKHIIELYGGK